MKKRLLFCPTNKDWGGSEILWSEVAFELSKNQLYEVIIYNYHNLDLPEKILLEPGIQKIKKNTSYRLCFIAYMNKLLPYRCRIKQRDYFYKVLQTVNPSLIVINQGFNYNGVGLMEISLELGYKYTTLSHAVCEYLWPGNNLRKKMQVGYVGSCANFFVSYDNLRTTSMQLAFEVPKGIVVSNPINNSVKNGLAFPDFNNGYHLAVVGRIHFASKGQDSMLRAMSSDKWKMRNLHINIYGDGPDLQNLLDLILDLDLKQVHYKGYKPPQQIWAINHGLLLTSRYEGLPIVIAEAMSAGRFVIVTDVSGNTELVEDGITGFIIEAPRPKYIDNILETAWNERERWQQMGDSARNFFLQKYPKDPVITLTQIITTLEGC